MLKSIKVPRRLLIKAVVIALACCTIIITLNESLSRPSVTQYKLKIERQIKLSFKLWVSNILLLNYRLDDSKDFWARAELIKAEKLANADNNEMWDLDPAKSSALPLDVHIPNYYKKGERKPRIQPFDARFTLGIYLEWVARNPGKPVPFHWLDWVDMSKLHKYVLSKREEKPTCAQLFDISQRNKLVEGSEIRAVLDYCFDAPEYSLGYIVKDFSGPQTTENHEVLSKSHLYSSFNPPAKIILLTESSGSYELDIKENSNDLDHSLLRSNMVESLKFDYDANPSINPLTSYKHLVEQHPPKKDPKAHSQFQITIPKELFSFDAHKAVEKLEKKRLDKGLSDMDEAYLASVRYSLGEEDPPKFFKEAKLLESHEQKWLGEHYDWRFFNGINVGGEEQLLSLHRLIRTYFNFARQHGLITWIAHGLLLSWYWNGVAFPWDTDIDVQMPITELQELGRRYNQTLVVENIGNDNFEFVGMGKYFVDVGSTLTHRTKGNGNNNIDARFIDIDTGLYIDITGLALTDTPAPERYDHLIEIDPHKKKMVEETKTDGNVNHFVKNQQLQAYNCRNNHFNTYEELSPLLLLAVENQLSYVPLNFFVTLFYEYGIEGFSEKNYRDLYFLNNFRIWVTTQIVLDYLNDPEQWVADQRPTEGDGASSRVKRLVGLLEKLQINKLSRDDHINLLYHNDIFKEFFRTQKFTAFHTQQLKELSKNSNIIYGEEATYKRVEQRLEEYRAQGNLGRPLRADLFMNKVFRHDWDYDREVEAILELQRVYDEKDN